MKKIDILKTVWVRPKAEVRSCRHDAIICFEQSDMGVGNQINSGDKVEQQDYSTEISCL